MSDQKAMFVPGSVVEEVGTQSKFMYIEAGETLKPGDEVWVDNFGIAKHVRETLEGVYIPPAKAAFHINNTQFGWILLRGGTQMTKDVLKARAQKKAESVIDTQTKVASRTIKVGG
jgi:hypothetical protein